MTQITSNLSVYESCQNFVFQGSSRPKSDLRWTTPDQYFRCPVSLRTTSQTSLCLGEQFSKYSQEHVFQCYLIRIVSLSLLQVWIHKFTLDNIAGKTIAIEDDSSRVNLSFVDSSVQWSNKKLVTTHLDQWAILRNDNNLVDSNIQKFISSNGRHNEMASSLSGRDKMIWRLTCVV